LSEIEIILSTIRAAKSANEAAILALTAVEQMLEPPKEKSVQETFEKEKSVTCTHDNAVEVGTLTGDYLICECGTQITI